MRSAMGSLKKSYENALAHEMRKSGLGVVQQRGIVVFCDDLIVEDQAIVELQVVGALSDVHVPQCRNYLRDQFRPVQSRNPPHHRRNLIARTIPFIPAYPLHPPQEKDAATAGRHCAADPEPDEPEP
jgi:hypothetical protein